MRSVVEVLLVAWAQAVGGIELRWNAPCVLTMGACMERQ